ncbi:MAG: hypothetical protein JSV81_03945 [Anaerolineales bacterium]|nr:MAG: hypothetical protein JSV81_03945 [Anaerolineales bacterium]
MQQTYPTTPSPLSHNWHYPRLSNCAEFSQQHPTVHTWPAHASKLLLNGDNVQVRFKNELIWLDVFQHVTHSLLGPGYIGMLADNPTVPDNPFRRGDLLFFTSEDCWTVHHNNLTDTLLEMEFDHV